MSPNTKIIKASEWLAASDLLYISGKKVSPRHSISDIFKFHHVILTKKPSSTNKELADDWTKQKIILDKAFKRLLNKKSQFGGKNSFKDYVRAHHMFSRIL